MKKLKDTKVGAWIKTNAPMVLDVVDDYFPPAKILTALVGNSAIPDDKKVEFEKLIQEHEKEMYELEIKDRDSARNREIEIAKVGGNDHLMYVSGYVALAAFLVMIFAVIFLPESVSHNSLFHQLMGIIEGVALTVFGYYFGTSKSSHEKTSLLK
jgi:hypothetical protein